MLPVSRLNKENSYYYIMSARLSEEYRYMDVEPNDSFVYSAFYQQSEKNIAQEDVKLANDLVNYLVKDYTTVLKSSPYLHVRLDAIKGLRQWLTFNHKPQLLTLLKVMRTDENPEIRDAIKQLISHIRD